MVRTDISLTSPELRELPQGTMVNVVEVVLAPGFQNGQGRWHGMMGFLWVVFGELWFVLVGDKWIYVIG